MQSFSSHKTQLQYANQISYVKLKIKSHLVENKIITIAKEGRAGHLCYVQSNSALPA